MKVPEGRKIRGIWDVQDGRKLPKTNDWPDSRPKMRSSRWWKRIWMHWKKRWKAFRWEAEAQFAERQAGSGRLWHLCWAPSFCLPVQWNVHTKKKEFKGWVTDNKKCSYQGLTDTEVSNFIRDLRKMVPAQFHKYTGWDHTRTEQGTWPSKTFVNMQFKNETNLATIIGLPEIVKEEIKKGPYKLHGQEVSARFEMSPKGSQRSRTQWVQERWGKFRSASLSEVQWLQNTLPEREGLAWPGISNLMLYRILWNTFRGNCQIKLTEESHFQTQSWPLISANVNRQRSLDIFTMKEKLLGPALARTQTSTILTIQETKSWDVPNLELTGYVCHGGKSGFATLLVSDQFCTMKRSWNFEERCTAIPVGTTVVMAENAPDSSKSLEMFEDCISSVFKVLQEGRRWGATEFLITSDLDVELGMMCADENDIEELMGIYGPLCRQEYDKEPGGFKKMMWCEITKEFDCKASSTWSVYGRKREDALTHSHLIPRKKEETSPLDTSSHRTLNPWIILVEVILTMVWWFIREFP